MIPQHLEENVHYRELRLRPVNFQRNTLGTRNFLDRLGHSKTLKVSTSFQSFFLY